MQQHECSVFFARNLSELFYHMKTIARLHIVGGCTRISRLPAKSISTRTIADMQQIEKHERYIECGPGVTLSEIEALGERHLPKVLFEAVRGIANPFVRNIATIGGNICAETDLADAAGRPLHQKLTLYAPLLALDAQLELRSFTKAVSLPLHNFTRIPDGHILTNIRVPINDWDVAIFRRFGPENKITQDSAAFTFLASTEKNMISRLRIAFSGAVTFRCTSLENTMLGQRLPFAAKSIGDCVAKAAAEFDRAAEGLSLPPIPRQQFLNLVHYSFEQLT